MVGSVVILAFGLAITSALPTDHVIAKMDPGLRYQYMVGPDGTPHLVDLWLKTSDVLASARYNPDRHNNYHLFTRSNPNISQPIVLGADTLLKSSNFDINKRTVLLVHGWLNTPTSDFNVYSIHVDFGYNDNEGTTLFSSLYPEVVTGKAYLKAEDVNVIMVDWSIGADTSYLIALKNCIRSAEHVAKFITWLNTSSGASINSYHFIGHSLGAHQVGIIGRHLGGTVPYITGLDAALPGWITNPFSFKSSDGIYTELMHTDIGYSGIIGPAADVDFYPNGGRNMPGCSDRSCSHHRCLFYMAESLYSDFTGRRCESLLSALNGNCSSTETLKMGGTVAKTGTTGIFYLTTNAFSPFSQG